MGKIWMPASSEAKKAKAYVPGQQTATSSSAAGGSSGAATQEALVQKRVDDMMKRAVTTTNPESVFKPHANGGIISREERVKLAREERREKRGTLSQWYGMKRQKMTPELEAELQLLRYRGLAQTGVTPKVPKAGKQNEFFETGYFVGVGKNRRRRLKSFADEWTEDDPRLAAKIQRMVARDSKTRRKTSAKRDAQVARSVGKSKKAEKRAERKRGKSGDDDLDLDDVDAEIANLVRERDEGRRGSGGRGAPTKRQAAKARRRGTSD